MNELKVQRTDKAAASYPRCRKYSLERPEGYSAGKLIADAELRGLQVGGGTGCPKTLWICDQ